MPTGIDFIGKGAGEGAVAQEIMANGGLNVGNFRPFFDPKTGKNYITVFKGGDAKAKENYQTIQTNTNTVLRRDEWKHLDSAVMRIAEARMVGINDLTSRGLVYNIGNPMGSTVLETHLLSDALEAALSMDGLTRGANDRQEYTTVYTPLPIVHADYQINARVLAASRNMGNPLDTSMAERAVRKVGEQLEKMLFTDTTYAFGGGTIYSYLNAPYRQQVTMSTAWDASGKTPAEIKDDLLAMKQALIDAHFYGPYGVYVPTAYETVLDDDYDATTPGTTIRERLLKNDGVAFIKTADYLTADNVLMVSLNSDTVRLVNGMAPTNVQWSNEGGMVYKYKVMAIQVPQIRWDANNGCGIAHLA